uniref:Uncharacterized protein n=1 Tax=Rhizophora mucronata TaxID=61149 RepID=A0A2P2M3C6_RHIMU
MHLNVKHLIKVECVICQPVVLQVCISVKTNQQVIIAPNIRYLLHNFQIGTLAR